MIPLELQEPTFNTCAPDFSPRLMTKLYAKIKGAHAISLFDFLKAWQVWCNWAVTWPPIIATRYVSFATTFKYQVASTATHRKSYFQQ